MFQRVCDKIVSGGINSGHMEKDKRDEYLYGMNMFFDVSINIVSMIIIGIITGRLWECIIFCIVYKFIRKYTGGFHFKSAWHCYISSCIMYFAVIGLIIYIPFKIYEVSAIVVISSIIMWFMSPVEAVNKPLDERERTVFKKRSRRNIVIMLAAYFVCLFISQKIAQPAAIGIICVMCFAAAGKIKLMAYKENEAIS